MKSVFLILSIFLSSVSFSQQMTYVDLDWVYDVTIPQSSKEDSIHIDADSNVDIVITSWFIYELTPNLGIEVFVKDYDSDFSNNFINVVDADPFNSTPGTNLLIKDCHNGTSQKEQTAYIYTNNVDYTNYTSGYFKVPFQFEALDGNHCGFLFVKYNENIITVEGYSWNEIPVGSTGWTCPCDNDYLSLDILDSEINLEVDKYFNLMGQEVTDPYGLVIVLYKNGLTKKMYIE